MTRYANGIQHISNELYHSSAGVSRSMLSELAKSPYHYWYKYVSGLAEKEESTPAMNLGNAVHTLVLEESKFDKEFLVIHQQTRPRRGTKPYDEMIKQANGKIILTNDEYLQAHQMARSIKNNENANMLLNNCHIENSIYFVDELTGIQFKSRPDALSGSIAIDIKTTNDASPDKFQNSAWNYSYYLQAAMAYKAMQSINQPMDEFIFICVEKEKPYCVAIYILDKDALNFGLSQFDCLASRLKKCMDSNEWPSYGIQNLKLPSYSKYSNTLEYD